MPAFVYHRAKGLPQYAAWALFSSGSLERSKQSSPSFVSWYSSDCARQFLTDWLIDWWSLLYGTVLCSQADLLRSPVILHVTSFLQRVCEYPPKWCTDTNTVMKAVQAIYASIRLRAVLANTFLPSPSRTRTHTLPLSAALFAVVKNRSNKTTAGTSDWLLISFSVNAAHKWQNTRNNGLINANPVLWNTRNNWLINANPVLYHLILSPVHCEIPWHETLLECCSWRAHTETDEFPWYTSIRFVTANRNTSNKCTPWN